MEIPSTILIVVGFIIVLLGIGAGMLLSSLNEEIEPEEDGVDQAPPGGRKGRYTPVVRLWRERGTGTLVVEMDNKSFLNAEPLSEIQRERLENTARDLRAWLGMGLSASAEPAPQAQSAPAPAPAQAAAASAAAASAAAASTVAAAPVPAPVASAAAESKPPYSPPPARSLPPTPVPVKVEPAAPLPLASKSIVMQIEDILQDMISGTPMDHRGIHLIEDPVRGVIVKVGAEQYEGIDSVADPEVKATIRAAVAEWEKSQ